RRPAGHLRAIDYPPCGGWLPCKEQKIQAGQIKGDRYISGLTERKCACPFSSHCVLVPGWGETMTGKPGKRGNSRAAPGLGLPEGMSGLELDARRSERLATVALLKTGRTPLTVIEVAEKAAELAENAVQEARKKYPAPHLACTEGCDWC